MLVKTLADKDASEEQRRYAEKQLADLAAKLNVTLAATTRFFKIVGEQSVPEDEIPVRLGEIASHFASTRDELAALDPDDPHIADLANQVRQALDAGKLAEADALLERAKDAELAALRQAQQLRQKAQEAEDRHALSAAKLLASRGDIAMTQLRYLEAAEEFKQAAALVPSGHLKERGKYLLIQAAALQQQGERRGDNAALRDAVAACRSALAQLSRDGSPDEWAGMQFMLGDSLLDIGQRESGTARLEEATASFRLGLEVVTRDRAPLNWAMIQSDLAMGLWLIGDRQPGIAKLEEALAALRLALQELTPSNAPIAWPVAQANLGQVLSTLGERTSDTAQLEESVGAFRLALPKLAASSQWYFRGMAEHGLGDALMWLGERDLGKAQLEEAVAAF